MTCREFMAMIHNTDPKGVTRAQRAIALRHVNGCRACHSYVMGIEGGDEPSDEIDALYDQDSRDPEFMDIASGEDDAE